MTPTSKEKAKELFEKFYYAIDEQGFCSVNKYRAKQCALIAVDEILKSIIWHHDFSNQTRNYWQEVKQEIEKL